VDKIKVLHIIKSLGRGGAEMLLQETLKKHNHEKFEFHYIYFLPWKNQMVEGIQKAGGIVTNIPATNNLKILNKSGSIIKYIRSNKINLIHCHLPWAGFVGRIIFKRTHLPVIYTEHNKQERYHFLTKYINRFTFNWQTIAIGVSGEVALSIQKNISPHIQVQTILNGVDTNYFVRKSEIGQEIRRNYNISPNALCIGTIAVFRFQKRLKEWIDIFFRLKIKHPDLYGFIIGDGPLKPEIISHIKNLGLENSIIMPGLQTDVLPWLSSIDIFMMSSLFEGLPIALLEAMSMECAIVSTNAGGIKEVIRSNEDGLLVPVDQWEKLENQIESLLQDNSKIITWGEKARKRAESAFSMLSMVNQTESLYTDLVN
jgi:glycosyltransferase involved in cell wall biosynthesis